MSKEDEAKPSARGRRKQPPVVNPSSEIKGSAEIGNQLSELITMLRDANLPAVSDRQSKLESQIETVLKAAEERSKAEKLRAENDEKRFKKLHEDNQKLIDNVKLIVGIIPKITEFDASFAGISGGVEAIDKRLNSLSEGVVELNGSFASQQMSFSGLLDSVTGITSSLVAIDAGIQGFSEKTAALEDKLISGHSAMMSQLDLFADTQKSISENLGDLKLAVEPLATRHDVALTVEQSRLKTRRTIKTIAALGQKEGEKAVATVLGQLAKDSKHHDKVLFKALKNVEVFVKANVAKISKESAELTGSTKELTASVAEAITEIQESKAILKAGSGAIVNAQRALLEIGPFVENQIMSSMNLVVTSVAPQVSNLFKTLIDSSDLKAIPALANQFELMLDEAGQNIESIRNFGEMIVSSNNNAANTNRDLMNQMGGIRTVADALANRLSGEELVAVSGKIERLSKSFASDLEDYKDNVGKLFSNLSNVLANRLGGELEAFVAKNKITQEELYTIAEVIGNQLYIALFEDSQKNVQKDA